MPASAVSISRSHRRYWYSNHHRPVRRASNRQCVRPAIVPEHSPTSRGCSGGGGSVFSAPHAVDIRKATRWTKMVKGSGKQAKRAVKEAVGKLTGDAKLKAEGKTDKTARKPPRTQA